MSRELLKKISQQLEAFIEGNYWPNTHILLDEIKAELAKPEPEPVARLAWFKKFDRDTAELVISDASQRDSFPVYTRPPAQQKPLSDDRIKEISDQYSSMFKGNFELYIHEDDFIEFARAIEKAHGIT